MAITYGNRFTSLPNWSASLDSLCRRYNIDLSERSIHGALKDAKLLASVYLELIGGKQPGFVFKKTKRDNVSNFEKPTYNKIFTRKEKLTERLTVKEKSDHKAFISKLKNNFWYN